MANNYHTVAKYLARPYYFAKHNNNTISSNNSLIMHDYFTN